MAVFNCHLLYIRYNCWFIEAASPERWCECSSAIDGSCYGTCHDEDNVGITNAVTNSSIDEGQEEYTDMMAQLREMSGIKYSTTNMKNKPHCNGPIYRFNYTCLQLADISSICSSETVSLTLNGAIWTKSYPVASDADRKSRYCTCNLHINAKGFKVIKYDYNLTNDQSLRLTFSNGSTYQDWNSPFNINDVANGNSSLKNANTDITVHWANPKLEQELFYIGFEVTNGTVNVTCEEGVIVAPSTISLPTNKINPAAPTAATNANTSTVSIGNITSIAPTPAVQTAASNTKKVTVSNGNIFSITPTLSISSKIASSSISSSLSNSSIEKTAVGESTRETSEQPNEKNKFPWYIILIVVLLLIIAGIIIGVIFWKKKKRKQQIAPIDVNKNQPACDTVANTKASAFMKSRHNKIANINEDNAGVSARDVDI